MTDIVFRVTHGLEVDLASIDRKTAAKLKQLFDYANPEHAKKKRLGFYVGNIPQRIQSWEQDGDVLVFPRGGAEKIRKALGPTEHGWWFEDRRLSLDPVEFEIRKGAVPPEPRAHQIRIVRAALEKENCLIRAATGSGKTEAALEIIRQAEQPALVIVWTSGLLRQWIDRVCLRWGWRKDQVGVWGSGKKRLAPITIGMQQTIMNSVDELTDKFGIVVCDEVHRFAAKTFREVIAQFPARYRIGVSADERRKDRMDFMIRDMFGDVATEVSKEELIAVGQLCEVEIVLVPTDFSFTVSYKNESDEKPKRIPFEDVPEDERSELLGRVYNEMLDSMEVDDERNEMVRILAGLTARAGRSTLVFCNREKQARGLVKSIAVVEEVPCGLMLGGRKNVEAFDDAKSRLTSGDLVCAVGSSAAYQGEDIPRLSVGIVATPTGNNKGLIEQQIGRLRRKFPGKVRGLLIYPWDARIFPNVVDNLRRWYGRRLVRVVEFDDLVEELGG